MPAQNQTHGGQRPPVQDSPYVRAKRCQLIDKDPQRAIPLFWASINANDRTDSALKDMAIVMKQQGRPEEAIEAIRSFRSRCSPQAQESLDNVLLDLYKRCGRLDDQIELLRHKITQLENGSAFHHKKTKVARSQGKKLQVSALQEHTRLLGNLGWAYMERSDYASAEAVYRRALAMQEDDNKLCNLAVCLMKQGKLAEAEGLLRRVKQVPEGAGPQEGVGTDASSSHMGVGSAHAGADEDCGGDVGGEERGGVGTKRKGTSIRRPAGAPRAAARATNVRQHYSRRSMACSRPALATPVALAVVHHVGPCKRQVVGPAIAPQAPIGATGGHTRAPVVAVPVTAASSMAVPSLRPTVAPKGEGALQPAAKQAAGATHGGAPPTHATADPPAAVAYSGATAAAPLSVPTPAPGPSLAPFAAPPMPGTATAANTATATNGSRDRAPVPPGFGAARAGRTQGSPLGEKRGREKDEDSGDGIRFSLAGAGGEGDDASSAPAPAPAPAAAKVPSSGSKHVPRCPPADASKDLAATTRPGEGPHDADRVTLSTSAAEAGPPAEPQLSLRPNCGRLVSPLVLREGRPAATTPVSENGKQGMVTRAGSTASASKAGKENTTGRDVASSKVTPGSTRESMEPLNQAAQAKVVVVGKAAMIETTLMYSLPSLPESLSSCMAELPLPGKRRKRLPVFENLAAMSPV
eukprot:jgi/Mesvir1/28046/Mv04649-RA.1